LGKLLFGGFWFKVGLGQEGFSLFLRFATVYYVVLDLVVAIMMN
jgi:hypothetical protein